MSGYLKVVLTPAQQRDLQHIRDRDHHPYLRERAAAILKVAAGQSASEVAYTALLRRHQPETISKWCKAYLNDGRAGLLVKPGRGRKPAFSPSADRRP